MTLFIVKNIFAVVHASVVLLGKSSTARLLSLKLVISNKLTKHIMEECSGKMLREVIAYFIATENLPYMKYPKICELETRRGVHVGTSYVILEKTSCTTLWS